MKGGGEHESAKRAESGRSQRGKRVEGGGGGLRTAARGRSRPSETEQGGARDREASHVRRVQLGERVCSALILAALNRVSQNRETSNAANLE